MNPGCKNRFLERAFLAYTTWCLRRTFHRVLMTSAEPGPLRRPLLVCVNHSRWWDVLVGFWLSAELLGWDSYAPMDTRQLARRPILSRIGLLGIEKEGVGGAREFLRSARELIGGRRRALWIAAQGTIAASDTRPVRQCRGIPWLARSLGDCDVATVVIQFELWDERRPEVFVSPGPLRRAPQGCAGPRARA